MVGKLVMEVAAENKHPPFMTCGVVLLWENVSGIYIAVK